MDGIAFLEAKMTTPPRRTKRPVQRPTEERAAQRERIRAAAEALRMDPSSFACWMLTHAHQQQAPSKYRPRPWLISVISATQLHRDEQVGVRLRQGWRFILTFHGKPFAMIVPLEAPARPTAASNLGRE